MKREELIEKLMEMPEGDCLRDCNLRQRKKCKNITFICHYQPEKNLELVQKETGVKFSE